MEVYVWRTIMDRFDIIDSKLNHCLRNIQVLTQEVVKMQQEVQVLIDKVTALKTVEDSATALLLDLAAKLTALATNAKELSEMKTDVLNVVDTITANVEPLAKAVADLSAPSPPTP